MPRLMSLTLFVLLVASVIPAHSQERVELIRKTDNFAFLLDLSGSMRSQFMGQGPRIDQAKALLERMNREIPDLGYNGGFYTIPPAQARLGMERYDGARFEQTISELDTVYPRLTRGTPIGRGLELLSSELAPLTGKVDVIMLTDGGQNIGPSPLDVAAAMNQEMGGRLCIHVISYARTSEETALVQRLAKATPCSSLTPAQDLQDDQSLKEFVEKIFYERRVVVEAKPAPAPTPAPAPAPAPEPVEEVIVLRGIHFDFDKSDIKPEFAVILDEAGLILQERPDVRVVIEGHTCSMGGDVHNQKLSERRAQSVRDYLVKHGIAAERLEARGYGKSRPAYDNSTREGRSLNRRVEFQVIK
jgi:OmpA-OmpF porin, OOP family